MQSCGDKLTRPLRRFKCRSVSTIAENLIPPSQSLKNLWGHLDRFALELDIITRCYSELLTSAPIPPTSRERFTDEEIKKVWDNQHIPWVDTILILLYSGWRIMELINMKKSDVNLEVGIMTGGIKTKAGKNRIVPIHSLIRPYIEKRMKEPGEYFLSFEGEHCLIHRYRNIWKRITEQIDLQKTPHECRHTFESILDSAGANRRCIDLMMGHVSKDTGNRVYNHKTIAELKTAIELITIVK